MDRVPKSLKDLKAHEVRRFWLNIIKLVQGRVEHCVWINPDTPNYSNVIPKDLAEVLTSMDIPIKDVLNRELVECRSFPQIPTSSTLSFGRDLTNQCYLIVDDVYYITEDGQAFIEC